MDYTDSISRNTHWENMQNNRHNITQGKFSSVYLETHGWVCQEQRDINDKSHKVCITEKRRCDLDFISYIHGKNKYIKLLKCTSVSKVSVNIWRRPPSLQWCYERVSDQPEQHKIWNSPSEWKHKLWSQISRTTHSDATVKGPQMKNAT